MPLSGTKPRLGDVSSFKTHPGFAEFQAVYMAYGDKVDGILEQQCLARVPDFGITLYSGLCGTSRFLGAMFTRASGCIAGPCHKCSHSSQGQESQHVNPTKAVTGAGKDD